MARILIVEDEERISSFLAKGLTADGYTTAVVPDGVTGLDYALSGDFDLVILDIGLPGMNGFEVLERMRASGSALPVVVLVLDKEQTPRYQEITSRLRKAGIRAEMFMGNTKNFGKQVAYADKRNAPAVIIEGTDERARGVVQIKDLVVGKEAAANITDNAEWKAERPGQFECADADIVAKISELPAVKAWLERGK